MKSTTPQAPRPKTRRDMLRLSGYAVIGGAALVAGGAVFAHDLRQKLEEQDLSVIGQGRPVVLQIHDPQCTLCAALQRETRAALEHFDEEAVLYRVVNIRTEEGSARQAAEGLPHVTLALYDGSGRRRHVVRGVTPEAQLVAQFRESLRLQPIATH